MTGKVLCFDSWPAVDRAAWAVAFAEGDVFDGRGPAAHWSAGSRRSVATGYGRWIGYLSTLEPDAFALPPAERVTPARLKAYLNHLAGEITPTGVFNYAKHLYDAIRVMAPAEDWAWLKSVVWRLEGRGQARRGKAGRMVTTTRLIDLGRALMEGADRERDPLKGAMTYRDGLVIALLICRPIRRRNLAMIEIGRHFVMAGRRWHLTFGSGETKNRLPYEAALPGFLDPYVARYLADFRPRFPGAETHEGLWASAKGCPMTEGSLYAAVAKRTKAAFGRPINLHLFRDIAATQVAYTAPADIGIARDLLGHGDLRAVDKHYNQASQIEAGRAYHAALLADRSDIIRSRHKTLDRR